jgi:hypothetical protein
MAANTGKPTPWHIPYSTLSGDDVTLPDYLGWVDTRAGLVVDLPKISTEMRNMCIGAVLILSNSRNSTVYLKAADGDTIEGEQYAFLGRNETGHVVATPNGDWSLVYVWVQTFADSCDAAMPATTGKIAAFESVIMPSSAASDVALIADSDVAPIADSDVAPIADSDVAPIVDSDVALIADSDVAPIADSDVAPIVDSDVALIVDSDVALIVDSDVAPIADSVVAPIADASAEVANAVNEMVISAIDEVSSALDAVDALDVTQ